MEKASSSILETTPEKLSEVQDEKAADQLGAPASPPEETNKTEGTDKDEYKYVTGFKFAIVMISVTLVGFIMMLDTSIIATAIPRITSDFSSLPDVGWYGSAFLLSSCSLQPLTGRIYTHHSSKNTFLAFVALFEIGSLLCGVATSSNMLIVGRAVAGMGASGIVNGILTIISACVPMEKRAFYLGISISVVQLAIVLGPLLGGLLTQYSTWRWCFYINLPIGGAMSILLFFIQIPDRIVKSETKSTLRVTLEQLDLLGFALFAPAIIQCLLALQWGGTRFPWNSATIIGLFCGAAANFAIFLAWENHKGEAAMIPLSIVRHRIVLASALVAFFFFGSLLIASYYLPIYFQAVRDASPSLSGVYVLPIIISQLIFSAIAGLLSGKLGYYLPWAVASGVLCSIGLGLLSTLTPTSPNGAWIGYQIIIGAGRGCGLQMPIVAIQNVLPIEQTSLGIAFLVFTQYFGGSLFLGLAQTILNDGLKTLIPLYAPEISAQTVIDAGASAIRDVVPESALPGVLQAYNQAIGWNFYLATGASTATFFFACGMGWRRIGKKEVPAAEV